MRFILLIALFLQILISNKAEAETRGLFRKAFFGVACATILFAGCVQEDQKPKPKTRSEIVTELKAAWKQNNKGTKETLLLSLKHFAITARLEGEIDPVSFSDVRFSKNDLDQINFSNFYETLSTKEIISSRKR